MRSLSRLLAFLFALSFAALGVIVAVEAWFLAAGDKAWLVPRADWNSALRDLRWDDTGVTVTAVGLALVGLLLLATQLIPRPPVRFAVRGTPEGRRVSMSRRGLEGQLTRLADRDPEVVSPSVRVGRRTAKVTAAFPTHAEPAEVGGRLRVMAVERLEQAQLQHPLKVTVRLRPAKQRVS